MADSFLRFGSYDHAPGSVQFTVRKLPIIGRTQQTEMIRNIWDIQGWIEAASPSAFTTAIEAVEAQYLDGTSGDDLKFMLDGATESAHTLVDTETIGGVEVVNFAWLGTSARGSGVEYVKKRSFAARIQGDTDPGYQTTPYVAWIETVTRLGDGGANYEWIESLAGAPQSQKTNDYTRCVTVQTGSAIGRLAIPAAPSPLWALPYYRSRESTIGQSTPSLIGGNEDRNYTRTWRYIFHSNVPLVGGPTEMP